VPAATDLLYKAIQGRQRICVYATTSDGLTAGHLLEALRLLGAPADFYVPHRLEEATASMPTHCRQIAQSGAAVVVTGGLWNLQRRGADEARRLGLELIVTESPRIPRRAAASLRRWFHPRLPGTVVSVRRAFRLGGRLQVAWACVSIAHPAQPR